MQLGASEWPSYVRSWPKANCRYGQSTTLLIFGQGGSEQGWLP